jgi:glycosyltransferase involved in cell wall biosynthesis
MRFLFFTHYARLYGANRSLLELIQILQARGHQCTVALKKNGPLAEKLQSLQIPYLIVRFPLWTVEDVRKSEAKSLRLLVRGLMQAAQYLVESLWYQTQKPRLQRLVRAQEIDIIQSNSITFGVGAALARRCGKPHIWHLRETLSDYNLTPLIGAKALFRKIASSARIYCISEYQKALLLRQSAELRQAAPRIRVLPNPVDTEENMHRYGELGKARKLFREAEIVFCIAGLVTRNKGQRDALLALARLKGDYPNIRLLIAGDVEDRGIYDIIREQGLEAHVELPGHVARVYEDVYLRSDATLMCSRHEAFGRVTIESMICRRPVIGYRGGATPEILGEDYGLLYDDIEALERQMRSLIEHPDRAKAIADKAFTEVIGRFRAGEHASQFLEGLTA